MTELAPPELPLAATPRNMAHLNGGGDLMLARRRAAALGNCYAAWPSTKKRGDRPRFSSGLDCSVSAV
jgi:hypothetical protein